MGVIDRPDYCLVNLLLIYPEYFEKMVSVNEIFVDRACQEIFKLMRSQGKYNYETIYNSLQNDLKTKFDEIYDTHFRKEDFDIYYHHCLSKYMAYQIEIVNKKMKSEYYSPDKIKDELYCIASQIEKSTGSEITTAKEVTKQVLQRKVDGNEQKNIDSHLGHIDDHGGLACNMYVIVGARPSTGKTSVILNMICMDIIKNIPVMFFTMETLKEIIIERCACIISCVPENRYRMNIMTENEQKRIMQAFDRIYNSVFVIDDTPKIEWKSIERKSKKSKKEYGIKKIYIDYLTKIKHTEKNIKTRYEKYSYISESIADLAKEIQTPCIVAAQLNRNVENKKREPIESDLKETGQIEQDADIILLLHDLDENDINRKDEKSRLMIKIAKFRDGPKGKFITEFNKINRRIKLQKGD